MTSNYFSMPKYLAPLNDVKAEDDFSVLTDRATIKYISKNICDSLHHPVTILDINRIEDVDNEKLRIDSDIEYFSLRSSCRLLRHCAGSEKCHECDRYHAKIFKNYLQENGKLLCYDTPEFFYKEYKKNPPVVLNGFPRKVLEYHCPMLGYRELLFPIYFNNNLIGILFLGQSIVIKSTDNSLIPEISKSFFENSENNPEIIFKNFLQKMNAFSEENANRIKELIMTCDKKTENIENLLRQPKNSGDFSNEQITMVFEDNTEYCEFINKACSEIDRIEKEFVEIANQKKEKYFYDISHKIVLEFLNQTAEIKNNDTFNKYKKCQNELSEEWKKFKLATSKLKEEFELRDVYLFGDGISIRMENSKEKHLYPLPDENSFNSKWTCDFSNINSSVLSANDYVCSLNNNKILERLNGNIDKNNSILLLYEDVAILLVVHNLKTYESLYKRMANAIGKNFLRIRLTIALSTANLMKERHVLTLRMNRHESTHISTKLSDNMKRYLGPGGKTFLELDEDKRELVVDDMRNTIPLISHMASNIGIITGSINPNTIKGKEKKLDVFDLLYKWQIMFRDKLSDRSLDLVILRESDASLPSCFDNRFPDAPRHIITNPELFELLVYNLVDNAVKYAYCGSTIYIRWCLINNENERYKLSVVSFGPEIKKEHKIYELYVRGNDQRQNAVDGDGIGLYVVKRIEKLLNLKVRDFCYPICKYYLPLIPWYINEKFDDSAHEIKQSYLTSYYNQNNSHIWTSVFNRNSYTELKRRDLSQEYLDARIEKETWMTTFEVSIGHSKNEI